jgi:site-specific DNA-methyltransferase (adenine-specific)
MIRTENAQVFLGSNLDVLPTLPDNSVDAIVTDPPYELGFMGKSWDSSGIAYSVELWRECLRVLKPGGHLLAFGGSRTWHRLAVAIEDAGFEMRDSIAWLYGSGFPKSMDVSKSIEAKLTTGSANKTAFKKLAGEQVERGNWGINAAGMVQDFRPSNYDETAGTTRLGKLEPTTEEAKKWAGWGTALKPAFEPVVVARKPLIGTVAANVLEWGVGGLNIDGSRIAGESWGSRPAHSPKEVFEGGWTPKATESAPAGRWPANIILDEHTAGLLDQQAPATGSWSKAGNNPVSQKPQDSHLAFAANYQSENYGDGLQGASRFFYVAKASKKDRNEGLEELESQSVGAKGNGLARSCATCAATVLDGCDCPDRTFVNPERKNFHPTVKPTAIMSYLIKLVAPEGATILDPFTGSGSTGKAALLNGYKFIGIELTEEYLPIIKGRLDHAEETYKQTKEEESGTLF